MIAIDLEQTVRNQIAADLQLTLVAPDRLDVSTPFMYHDGDHCAFTLMRDLRYGEWVLTDEGEVLMHASYSGTNPLGRGREERLWRTLQFYGLTEVDGSLVLPITSPNKFGEAVFAFTQACLDSMHLSRLPAERRQARPTDFRRKLRRLIGPVASATHVETNWHHPTYDPHGVYKVDFLVHARSREIAVFGITSEKTCLKAAITCLHYKQLAFPFDAVAIYNNEEELPVSTTTPLNEAVSVRFPSVNDDEAIAAFFKEAV